MASIKQESHQERELVTHEGIQISQLRVQQRTASRPDRRVVAGIRPDYQESGYILEIYIIIYRQKETNQQEGQAVNLPASKTETCSGTTIPRKSWQLPASCSVVTNVTTEKGGTHPIGPRGLSDTPGNDPTMSALAQLELGWQHRTGRVHPRGLGSHYGIGPMG